MSQLAEAVGGMLDGQPEIEGDTGAAVISLVSGHEGRIAELRASVALLPRRPKPKNKPFNVDCDPSDIDEVSRIVFCKESDICKRAIVNYGLHLPESRHTHGLAPEIVDLAQALGKRVVTDLYACDHHGGAEYVLPPVK